MEFITINESATLTGKSVQTIRRMVKKRKIQTKRQRTAQGFNYMVNKESLLDYARQTTQTPSQPMDPTIQAAPSEEREHRPITQDFASTIQKLVDQHSKDKDNLFQLIKTFQDRVFTLESHIKLLESPQDQKRWWHLW